MLQHWNDSEQSAPSFRHEPPDELEEVPEEPDDELVLDELLELDELVVSVQGAPVGATPFSKSSGIPPELDELVVFSPLLEPEVVPDEPPLELDGHPVFDVPEVLFSSELQATRTTAHDAAKAKAKVRMVGSHGARAMPPPPTHRRRPAPRHRS